MAQDPLENTDGKVTPRTKTLSVRLPFEQWKQVHDQAKAKGFKNVNSYLGAMINLIAPLVPEQREQVNQSNELPSTDTR